VLNVPLDVETGHVPSIDDRGVFNGAHLSDLATLVRNDQISQ